jgi:hypothetical protein
MSISFGPGKRAFQARAIAQLISSLSRRRADDQRVQLEDIHQREIHRLELAGATLSHSPLLPWGVRVVIGEDLQRLAMLGHQTLPNVSNVLADLLGRYDPQLAARQLLNEY